MVHSFQSNEKGTLKKAALLKQGLGVNYILNTVVDNEDDFKSPFIQIFSIPIYYYHRVMVISILKHEQKI